MKSTKHMRKSKGRKAKAKLAKARADDANC